MGIYSFYRKILYIKNKSKNINLFYTKFIPNIERSLTQLKWIDKSTFFNKKVDLFMGRGLFSDFFIQYDVRSFV